MAADHAKLEELGNKDYKAQAVWFLNAFWDSFGQAEAERIWGYAQRLATIDINKKMQGNAVDEFQAHQFLEQCKETLTVLQMREHLRSVGIEKHKLVPFVHYLIFRYKVDWHVLVNAPQGNPEEIARAQRMLDEVQALLAEAQRRADAAKAAEREAAAREADAKRDEAEAKRTEAEAKRSEAEAVKRADESRAAQQELEAALAELHAQEEAYNNKTEDLKRKSEDGSLVQRNKAKNELAQHLGEDPLPLRRAKITQEAAVEKADRATKAAEAAAQAAAEARQAAEKARRAAEQARQAAEQARHAAERAREAAEDAVREAEEKVAEAEAFLEEVKRLASGGKGALWWIDRELHEAKAYMPASKGGYRKDK